MEALLLVLGRAVAAAEAWVVAGGFRPETTFDLLELAEVLLLAGIVLPFWDLRFLDILLGRKCARKGSECLDVSCGRSRGREST